MYVAFEGIDTCGKSTQIELLKPKFPDAIFTKEPGGSIIGSKIRDMLLSGEKLDNKAEFFLFLADRAQHCFEVIVPNKDKMIIADRSLISGIAYAKNIVCALEYNLFATQDMLPDKVVLFRIGEELLKRRLEEKRQDVIEERGVEYLMHIQERLFEITHQLRLDTLILDASLSIEELHQQIIAFL
ncbi:MULTISPECIES: dTMP kinase [unclassified Helicobacter]|uniref:dTMP kinase n=1 Tax=unclassified Helicobacter TaxID=2593540 RepID=UPI000CF1518A|nr:MULTISPECIES: dTMP kinase [unclassified Helicobacter]